jgi:kynurenine formamidase
MIMRKTVLTSAFAPTALFALFTFASATTQAQSWMPPAESQRCPSKWGAGDERGSGNHMKPASVLKAAKYIRTGEVIEIGQVLRAGMPLQATRQFNLHTKRTAMNPEPNERGSNEELVTAEMGQVGTQFDGFTHQTHRDSLYNCFKVSEIGTRNGFTKMGMEKVGALMTRGVMIDVAGLKGVDTLPDSYEITPDDLQQALKRQNMTLEPGDAVIIHTGWGRLWGKENARYMTRSPGIGVAAGQWLVTQDPMLLGADNIPVEVAPPKDPKLSGPIHQMMLVVHGIHLLENLKLDELAAKKVYEFAFVMQPLKLQGATGSTVAPIAIR